MAAVISYGMIPGTREHAIQCRYGTRYSSTETDTVPYDTLYRTIVDCTIPYDTVPVPRVASGYYPIPENQELLSECLRILRSSENAGIQSLRSSENAGLA